MDWNAFRLRVTQNTGGEDLISLEPEDFGDEPLLELPDHYTVLFSGGEPYWTNFIRREGMQVHIWISTLRDPKELVTRFSNASIVAAFGRAVKCLACEGHPFTDFEITSPEPLFESAPPVDPSFQFARWRLIVPATIKGVDAVRMAEQARRDTLARATAILNGSDSVLLLGQDTGDGLQRLTAIKTLLLHRGIEATLVKQESDRQGDAVIQKVLRLALVAEFVIVENSAPSGHLYELPHVAKLAECIVAVLQLEGMGATWMFEDAFARHQNWGKFVYTPESLEAVLWEVVEWARKTRSAFDENQRRVLPWRQV